MPTLPRALWFCACIVVLSLVARVAQASPSWRASQDVSDLFEIVVDSSDRLTIDDVSREDFQSRFAKPAHDPRNLGPMKHAVWARLTLHVDAADTEPKALVLRFVHVASATLYRPRGDGSFEVSASGTRTHLSEREVSAREPTFPLSQAPGSTATYYLRIEDPKLVSLAAAVWGDPARRDHEITQIGLLGAYYGMLGALLLYNLALFFAARSRTYVAYVAYVACLMAFMATQNGLVAWTLVPEHSELEPPIRFGAMIAANLSVQWFTREFLDTKRLTPRLDRWLSITQWVGVGVLLLDFLAHSMFVYWIIAAYCMSAVTFTYATGTYFAFRKRTRAGAFHFVAFAFTYVGAVCVAARTFGVAPIGFLTEHGMQVGVLFEVVLLGVGLSSQVSTLRQEKEGALRASLTDPLTGLWNRSGLMQDLPSRLTRAARKRTTVAVIAIDLDGFKAINDSHGHGIGDSVLCEAATRLRAELRTDDAVARMGGDEFVVAIEDANDLGAIMIVAEKIRHGLTLPLRVQTTSGKTLHLQLSSSLGIATWDGATHEFASIDAAHVGELLDRADKAMYVGKRAGKNRVELAGG
jgi:diguanylate cyclase (GGDEF)-like protein